MKRVNWPTVLVCLIVTVIASNSSAVASTSSTVVQQLIAINPGWGHAISVHQKGTTGEVSAANFTSSNTHASAVQVSGVESGRGSIKVTHSPSASGATDPNASGLSIHIAGTGTAAQGIFVDNDGTGAILDLRHKGKVVFEVLANGTILKMGTGKTGPPVVNAPNGTMAFSPDGTRWRRSGGKWVQNRP